MKIEVLVYKTVCIMAGIAACVMLGDVIAEYGNKCANTAVGICCALGLLGLLGGALMLEMAWKRLKDAENMLDIIRETLDEQRICN